MVLVRVTNFALNAIKERFKMENLYLDKESFEDEYVSDIVIIDTLPGGFNQKSELLPEPIEILKFEKISSKLSLERKVKLTANYITPEEGIKMIRKTERLYAKSDRKCSYCGGDVPRENFSRCNTCVKLKNVVD